MRIPTVGSAGASQSTAQRCRRQRFSAALPAAGIASARQREDAELHRPGVKREAKDFQKWGAGGEGEAHGIPGMGGFSSHRA